MSGASPPFECFAAELGHKALAGAPLPELARDVASAVRKYLQADFSSVLQLLPDGRAQFLAGEGWNAGVAGETAVELGPESAGGQVIRDLEPLILEDIHAEQRYNISPVLREHQIISCLLVPLHDRNRPLGILGVHTLQRRLFSAQEVGQVRILANTLSLAIAATERQQPDHSQKLLRAEQMMAIGQVAAGVAHELRNPLTSIKGLVQVNFRDLQARGIPAEDLAVMEHEIRRMERTLQTFLEFARPPQPNREVVDVPAIVERVLALVGGRARKQGTQIAFEHPQLSVTAEVDFDQIQQVLLNLVLNALDALPKGGRVDVHLKPPRDGFVEIAVYDNGPGIAPQILPKVFETFVSSKETGVGLGLPLSRKIAEDHGGQLTAYNLPSAGACFVLRLPARQVPETRAS